MLALKMSALFLIHSVLLQIFVSALRFNLLTPVLSSHVTTFSLHGSKLLPQVCRLLSRISSALAQNSEVQSPSNRSANRKTCGTGREQTSLGCARFDALWIFLCGCRICACALTAWLIPALIWSGSFTCTSKMDQNQQDAQVSCPLCDKEFTQESIQLHASFCGEEEEDSIILDVDDSSKHLSCLSDILKFLQERVDNTKTNINVTRDGLYQRGLKQRARQKQASPKTS
ncbi:putative LOC107375139-like protein [Nothobranchius furzeri]|uniref:LOC107375139-like protein n=1 Tax=Nothobranchius furzeri TaxID=105023 RepID=A0A9D2YDE9_NOTFU|nr:putative LOC107375139-like protein [Nothobranchius furzeri]